jgi:aryl-alcohol dehydrogenase-like predicted oxidoreductase
MAMETRKIGSLDVSVVGLGTNNFGFRMDGADVPAVVDAALDAGITFFDTADSYGRSERRLAKALGARRDDVVLATKFASPLGSDRPGGARPEYVRSAVERSLRELATDHIDMYQIHRPDPDTPIADTLATLDELVQAGAVREIGCSNFSADQLVAADRAVKDGRPASSASRTTTTCSTAPTRRMSCPRANGWGWPTSGTSPSPAGS